MLAATAALFLPHEPAGGPLPVQPAPRSTTGGPAALAHLPVAFVPNLGQWGAATKFVARLGAMTVFLEERGWLVTLRGRTPGDAAEGGAVRMTFAGAHAPELVPEQPLPGRHHYILGNDPARWRRDVPLCRAVRYHELQPGVDVRAREQDGHFEYDLLLQPCADLGAVAIEVAGAERLHLAADGALVLETRLGAVRMPAPCTWEVAASGATHPVTCRYVLLGAQRFGFAVEGRRAGWSLVVDPGLLWSSYFGGGAGDEVLAVALDPQGVVTIAGNTLSADQPTTTGAFDTTLNGNYDAFVARLAADGTTLVFATFLGGLDGDGAQALAVDAQGAVTVAGYANSADFPVTAGAFDPSHNGVQDAFVTRLAPDGASLVWSTFLGGAGEDEVTAIALDLQGAATVAGQTWSADFPTTSGAHDTGYDGSGDAFVTRFGLGGATLARSTFVGGTNTDWPRALAQDLSGAATIAGQTDSTNHPTTPGAFDTTHNGGYDAFVCRLSPAGTSLLWSTFLGGSGNDYAYGLAIDGAGTVTVAGGTQSTDFPTTQGAFDRSGNGGHDAFVARLAANGTRLFHSTYLGGGDHDFALGLALDARGAATVVGRTSSADFPATAGAFDRTHNGLADGFVTRLDLLPIGVTAFGRSSPGCTGPLAMSVTSIPRIGSTGFAITCSHAPPGAPGVLVLAAAGLPAPIPLLGVEIWLDPASVFFLALSTRSDPAGGAESPLPLPADPTLVAQRVDAQFFWVGPTTPPPCPPLGLSASNALEIVIQP